MGAVFSKKLSVIICICVLLMTCLGNASIAFAEGAGSGTPGSTGEKPLAYLGTVVVDGGNADNATDISEPKLKVEFDKNVVNSLVWTNNSQCFNMKSSNNEAIPINVTKVDDTVDFAQRQFIFIQPVSALKPGTSYKLIISPGLMTKNGITIGQGVTVAFKTKGEAIQQAPPATITPAPKPATTVPTATPTPSLDNSANGKTITPNTVNPSDSSDSQNQSEQSPTITSGSSDNLKLDAKLKRDEQATPSSLSQSSNATKEGSGMSSTTWITMIGAVLLAAWITVEFIARKKRK